MGSTWAWGASSCCHCFTGLSRELAARHGIYHSRLSFNPVLRAPARKPHTLSCVVGGRRESPRHQRALNHQGSVRALRRASRQREPLPARQGQPHHDARLAVARFWERRLRGRCGGAVQGQRHPPRTQELDVKRELGGNAACANECAVPQSWSL